MRYMDRGNYIKRNGYCSTISCETKGQKKWWKKIERKNGRWNGKLERKICECRWLVSEMLNTITIDSFYLFVLFKYCIENKVCRCIFVSTYYVDENNARPWDFRVFFHIVAFWNKVIENAQVPQAKFWANKLMQ